MSQQEYQRWHGQPNGERGAFSVDEFCAWARIGRSKFYQEIQQGRLRLRKIGRKSIVTVADAEPWLQNLPEANDGRI